MLMLRSNEFSWSVLRGLGQFALQQIKKNKRSQASLLPYSDIDRWITRSQRSDSNVVNVFDRKAKRLQRDRTALQSDYQIYEYVKEEIGYRVADRICDVKRKFGVAVDLGCGRGHVSKHIYSDMVQTLYQCELSPMVLHRTEPSPEVTTYKVLVDEEFLPFKPSSLDLVVSNLSLHWVNDLPGCLKQVYNALKNDGVLIGSIFGGDTLFELRVSLQLAETEREGGFAPHISPFITTQDLGTLLNRAGYTMLTIDVDEMTVNYPSMYELMFDLKGMGENNCAWSRKLLLHRDSMLAAASIYKEMYGNDFGIPASYQIIFFIGWKPDPTQPLPAKRGSGQVSMQDIARLNQLAKDIKNLRDDSSDGRSQVKKVNKEFEDFLKKHTDTDTKK